MEKSRVYFVVDMKSFFASVECAERGLNPFSTNLVVADPQRTQTTICLAITPAMKKLGVKNRCRLYEIPQNLKYIIASPQMSKYIEYASKIYALYLKYIDKADIHVYSIDECFLDVTDYLKLYKIRAKSFAKKLIGEIWEQIHVPATVGIGTNLFLAKIALDITAKRSKDSIGWLDEEKFKKELWHHKPLTDFWQISTGISSRLLHYGIDDMFGIAHCKEEILYKEFGVNAQLLLDHAWGREPCLMSDIKNYRAKSRSISSSQILSCNYNFEDARIIFQEMIQNSCYDLFKQGFVASVISFAVGYGDGKRSSVGASLKINEVTNLNSILSKYFLALFDEKVDRHKPIRKLSIGFSSLRKQDEESYSFFVDKQSVEKEKNLTSSIISLHSKFGKNSVLKGFDLNEKATQRERNMLIGGHRSGKK